MLSAITAGGALTRRFGSRVVSLHFDSVNHVLYESADVDTSAEFDTQLNGVSMLTTSDVIR